MSFNRYGVWRPSGLLAGLVLGVWIKNTEPSWAQGCETVDADRCSQTLSTGIEMSYIEVGPEDGPAVILIHGLTDNVRSWATTMASLHELDPELRIMAVDLRGHGRSSMPDAKECAPAPEKCFRPADFAEDIVVFMQAKEITKATLAGHSLGSFIVQEVALIHPEIR